MEFIQYLSRNGFDISVSMGYHSSQAHAFFRASWLAKLHDIFKHLTLTQTFILAQIK